MKVRIVSSGTGRDTHVFAVSDEGDLHPIHGVQAVEFSIPGPRERATAKLTVRVDANVVGEVEEWRPMPRDPTILEGSERSLRVALYLLIPAVASTIGYVIAKL